MTFIWELIWVPSRKLFCTFSTKYLQLFERYAHTKALPQYVWIQQHNAPIFKFRSGPMSLDVLDRISGEFPTTTMMRRWAGLSSLVELALANNLSSRAVSALYHADPGAWNILLYERCWCWWISHICAHCCYLMVNRGGGGGSCQSSHCRWDNKRWSTWADLAQKRSHQTASLNGEGMGKSESESNTFDRF